MSEKRPTGNYIDLISTGEVIESKYKDWVGFCYENITGEKKYANVNLYRKGGAFVHATILRMWTQEEFDKNIVIWVDSMVPLLKKDKGVKL